MRVLDLSGKVILKAPMSQNRTFKINLDVMEHKCLATSTSKDEWLWHYKLGHLIFKDISNLKRKNIVQVYRKSIFQMKCVKNVFRQSNTRTSSSKIQEAILKPPLWSSSGRFNWM